MSEARLRNRHPFTEEFQALDHGAMPGRNVDPAGVRRPHAAAAVLSMMVALKSWEEFELHVRAGLEHELSQTELKEMLMLAAVYCGVPSANTAFAQARKIIGP